MTLQKGGKVKGYMLARIAEWGSAEDGIRAVILTGSRAGRVPIDELADYDLALFVTDSRTYTDDDAWMSVIDDVWVYVPEMAQQGERVYPTRLVIFRDGVKVDFSFIPVDALADIVAPNPLPECYDIGYRVLIDKTGLCDRMAAPSFRAYRGGRPTETEYLDCVREFWFETHHVVRYLKRCDLWPAKFRAWAAKQQLIRMIEWNEKAKRGWDYRTHPLGKQMESWVDPEIWRSLHGCFARFDGEDSWKAAFETSKLFGRVARDTARLLACQYPEDIERNIVGYAARLFSKDRA